MVQFSNGDELTALSPIWRNGYTKPDMIFEEVKGSEQPVNSSVMGEAV